MSAPMDDDDDMTWLCPDCTGLSEDRVIEHKRMQNSSFWLFFWNHVYNNEGVSENATRANGAVSGPPAAARGRQAIPVRTEVPVRTGVAQELINKFENVKIALIKKADVDEATQTQGIKYEDSMIFENGPAIQWTVERCEIFQDVLVKDCELQNRRTRPAIVPAQHYVLKLPNDFKTGEYSIGVVEYDYTLAGTRGMFFTARDVDAEHVFESSVLDHKGKDWQWDDSTKRKEFADPHGFHRLFNGKFLCEKEPNKALHEDEIIADEFGRNTIWIEMPSNDGDLAGLAGPATIGELGGIIPAASGADSDDEKRVDDGYIVALGFELQTHDSRAVKVFTQKP